MDSGQPAPTPGFQEPTTIWNKSFISIFFANMALNMGLFMSNSLLSVYASSLGASESAIGLLAGAFAISAVMFRMISAPIMDAYNRKYIVAFAALMIAAAFFGFSMANGFHMLFGFRLLQGCGMAFGNACCLAMASETLPKDKYTSGIGYFSLAQVMCQAIGPSVGLALADRVGFPATYVITACIMLIAAFLAVQMKTGFKRTRKLKISLNNIIAKEAILPSSVIFILGIGNAAVGSFLVLFARAQGVTSNIGLYFTVTAITMIATRPAIGKLTDRYGLVKVAVPTLVCTIISFYITSISASLLLFLLAAVVSAFGYSACQPAMQALTMKAAPNERRGAASSTNYIGMDTGYLLGSVISGRVAQSFGYVTMWRVMPAFLVIGILIIIFFRGTITRIEEDFAS